MFTKLPRWVEVGGFSLAAIAGAVNAVGMLGFKQQAVSHLTGTSTLLSLSLVNLQLSDSAHLVLIVISFVLGATLSGALIDNAVLRLGYRYSVALLIEAALLLIAMLWLSRGAVEGQFLASAACGLQNGMVSTYSGATVRTTHVSGLFTDLGTMFGARLRGHRVDTRKAVLFLLLICGFIFGGAIGAFSYERLQFATLMLPAAGAIALAGINGFYVRRRSR